MVNHTVLALANMNHTSTRDFEWEPLDFLMIAVMCVIVVVAVRCRPGRGVVFHVENVETV
jgi:hypothetical protein